VAGRVLLILLLNDPPSWPHTPAFDKVWRRRDTLPFPCTGSAQGRPRPRPQIRAAPRFFCDVVLQPVIYRTAPIALLTDYHNCYSLATMIWCSGQARAHLARRDRLGAANRQPAQINWRRALPRPLVPGHFSGKEALDNHEQSQTEKARTLTAVASDADKDNGVTHSTYTVSSTSTPSQCQLADRVRARKSGETR
jgi:hypothetical protein